MNDTETRYYGKYRGIVDKNNDTDGKMGRIKAKVPSLFGDEVLDWAMPCVPYAGDKVGLFLIPPEKASVWIEFENGDREKPIWSGCFWHEGESLPVDSYNPYVKRLKTGVGTITIDDDPDSGTITIETTNNMKIEMTMTGIEITNGTGKIKLEGLNVSINDGALEVS